MSKPQLAFLIAFTVASTSCRKSAAPAESHDASENQASIAAVEIDAGHYEPVTLDDIRDSILRSAQTPVRFQDQPIEFIELFDAPPNGELASAEKCTSPYKEAPPPSFPSFPNIERPEAPPCFRLVAGKIDPASVIPHAQMRTRVRGVFHVAFEGDASDPLYESTLTLDAIEPLPDPDYVEMPIKQVLADRFALQDRRITMRGKTLTWFEGTPMLSPVDPDPFDAGTRIPAICLRAVTHEALIGGRLNHFAFLHVRGRLVITDKSNGCDATLNVDWGERVTPNQAR